MSAIREYLELKAAEPGEWLRRQPRETHPAILQAVRDALADIAPSPGGVVYDDDVERFTSSWDQGPGAQEQDWYLLMPIRLAG